MAGMGTARAEAGRQEQARWALAAVRGQELQSHVQENPRRPIFQAAQDTGGGCGHESGGQYRAGQHCWVVRVRVGC